MYPSRIIDEGSYAVIYKYEFRGKDAAAKAFCQQLSKKRVLEISNQLRQLRHENIIRFRGYSVRPSALVFEFCEVELGGDVVNNLRQLITIFNENEHFILLERINYINQATQGLDYLHAQGVIHRNFKTANLLVSGTLANITVKVADFDTIVDLKQTFMATSTFNQLRGMTLGYMAPEICNRAVKTSCCTDIFSWAITSYEILSHLTSSWQEVLPILNDQLLLDALNRNERPDIENVLTLNNYSPECEDTCKLIKRAWHQQQDQRTTTKDVCFCLFYFTYHLSIHPRVCLTVCSRVCLTVCSRVCLTVCSRVCLTVCSRVCLTVCSRVCLTVCSRVCLTVCSRVCLTVCSRVCLTVCSRVCLTVCSRVCLTVCSRVCLTVCSRVCLTVCSRVCLTVCSRVCLTVCSRVCLTVCSRVCLTVCSRVCLTVCSRVCLTVCSRVCLTVCSRVCLTVCSRVCLTVCSRVCLTVCSRVCLTVCSRVCLTVCSRVCLTVCSRVCLTVCSRVCLTVCSRLSVRESV